MSSRRPSALFLAIALAACADPAAERAAPAAVTTTGLDAPLLFDAQYYASLYPDLQAAFGSDVKALRSHWLGQGIYESRRASPSFDCGAYLALNPELGSTFGSDCAAAMNHFLTT